MIVGRWITNFTLAVGLVASLALNAWALLRSPGASPAGEVQPTARDDHAGQVRPGTTTRPAGARSGAPPPLGDQDCVGQLAAVDAKLSGIHQERQQFTLEDSFAAAKPNPVATAAIEPLVRAEGAQVQRGRLEKIECRDQICRLEVTADVRADVSYASRIAGAEPLKASIHGEVLTSKVEPVLGDGPERLLKTTVWLRLAAMDARPQND